MSLPSSSLPLSPGVDPGQLSEPLLARGDRDVAEPDALARVRAKRHAGVVGDLPPQMRGGRRAVVHPHDYFLGCGILLIRSRTARSSTARRSSSGRSMVIRRCAEPRQTIAPRAGDVRSMMSVPTG